MASGGAAGVLAVLRRARAALAGAGTGTGARLAVVVGNEAADLDSVVSALGLAVALAAEGEAHAAVPLVAVPRADLALRGDAAWVLPDAGVPPADLLFADDADVADLVKAGRAASVSLVDHNVPAGGVPVGAVSRVVDHHEDAGLFAGNETVDFELDLVGSCASLVTERLLRSDAGAAALDGDAALRRLLLSAVLLDTQCFDEAAARSTSRDRDAADALTKAPGALREGETRETLYATLKQKRFDQSALSATDLLRRDYKQWSMGGYLVGIASMGVPLERAGTQVAWEPPLPAACAAFAEARALDALVLMSSFDHPSTGAFTREIAFVPCRATDAALLQGAVEHFRARGMELTPLPEGRPDLPLAFVQHDVKASRKKVQPLIAEYLEGDGVARL